MTPSADDSRTAEIAATLEVIEATLAGEPADPAHAEVAELVLLLADQRPKPADEFARKLDRRVEDGFGAASKAATKAKRRRNWPWVLAPAGGLAALVAIVVLIAVNAGGSGSFAGSGASVSSESNARPTSAAPRAIRQGDRPPEQSSSPGVAASPGLHPPANGRKLIQSSQLTLGARPARIETVAQEALKVVGSHNGFVDSATVNAAHGSSGYANLHLTVPSATLPQTMTLLSRLTYSTVVSRTDNVEDVTAALQRAKRHHQKARVHALEHGIAYSKVSLYIRADTTPSTPGHRGHGGGFTLGRAAHDALGVLTVIGGITLIALAVLVPLAVIVALGWNVRGAIRRRQREQALDLA